LKFAPAPWLRATLANGPLPAIESIERARADGIAEKTLRRAAKLLGVRSKRLPAGWAWFLAPKTVKTPEGDEEVEL
jgi:hypothetical protein